MGGVFPFFGNCANAQITPDSTLPNNSNVTQVGNTSVIDAGTQAGRNLFHSFKEFSVPTGGTAFFNNAVDIQNIISRVTGGSVSNIDGLIRANGTANLFLINPNGIIFGPNASLNIGGSFIGSTASNVNFADGTKFSATPSPDKPLLTITAPVGLNMGSNPGTIQVQGPGHDIDYQKLTREGPGRRIDTSFTQLQVKPGKTLALVGGNVSLQGGILTSEAGRVEIGSVASNGVVNLVPLQEGWKLGYEGTPSFRDIQFSGKAFVNTTGDGSGSIAVAGRNINFTEQSILLADTLGEKNGGEISIVGDSIVFNQSNISSNTFSSGNAGQIKLDANNIKIENRSGAIIQTGNSGDAGNINIRANSLTIEESSALFSITTENSTGKAGDINMTVKGPLIIVESGIGTQTLGTGNAGKITINANSLWIEDSGVLGDAIRTAAGQAGEINLNVAGSVVIKRTGITTNTFGTGNAGKISINANSFRVENTGIISNPEGNSTGKAGEININVALLEVTKRAGISTSTDTQVDAGKIDIRANSFLLESSGVNSSRRASSTGKAGDINVQAGTLVIDNGGALGVQNTGSGDAGNLKIVANTIKLDNKGQIDGTTISGNGGNLTLDVANLLLLRRESQISATAGTAQQPGDGGNITINAPDGFIVANRGENSDITANAFDGQGGKITIKATGIFGIAPLSRQELERLSPNNLDPSKLQTNDITAISQTNPSLSGTIQLITPDVDVNRGLVELPANLVDISQQIDTGCNPGSKQRRSSFVITGRGGLPPNPSDMLTPDAVLVDLITLNPNSDNRKSPSVTTKPTTNAPERIVEATGWVRNSKGEVILTANPPTTTPHESWQKPVSCRAS
jgi:filamentous hemagglutinin family protein